MIHKFESFNESKKKDKKVNPFTGISKEKVKVKYKGKEGTIVDSNIDDVDGEKINMIKIKFDDGSDSWECSDDKDIKYIKKK